MTRLILLDRDGVINFDSPDYIKDADEWRPIPGSLDAIAELKHAGYLVAVCTNQAGVGRGIFSLAELDRIHGRMVSELAARGVVLDSLRYCPHHPAAGCECRKPRPGMLTDTMALLGVSAADTVYVGDNLEDVAAAQAAGCRAALVRTGSGAAVEQAARAMNVCCVADDLAAFVRALLREVPC
jgi:D-glycero-D-manno-heptose 1,7-bisphosphate phosphatase